MGPTYNRCTIISPSKVCEKQTVKNTQKARTGFIHPLLLNCTNTIVPSQTHLRLPKPNLDSQKCLLGLPKNFKSLRATQCQENGWNPKKVWKESNCTIIIYQKMKFEIMCHMMGCNDSSGKHRQRGGTAFAGFCPPPLKVYDLDRLDLSMDIST